MQAFKVPDDIPIESGLVSKAVNQAQTKLKDLILTFAATFLILTTFLINSEVLFTANGKNFNRHQWLGSLTAEKAISNFY